MFTMNWQSAANRLPRLDFLNADRFEFLLRKMLSKIFIVILASILNASVFLNPAFAIEKFQQPEIIIYNYYDFQHPVIIYPDTNGNCIRVYNFHLYHAFPGE